MAGDYIGLVWTKPDVWTEWKYLAITGLSQGIDNDCLPSKQFNIGQTLAGCLELYHCGIIRP